MYLQITENTESDKINNPVLDEVVDEVFYFCSSARFTRIIWKLICDVRNVFI